MKLKLIITCCILFISITIVNAQSASDILNKLQNKFKTVEDFTANYSGSLISNKRGLIAKFEGKIFYKKSKKIKIVTKRRVIVSDGNSLWTFDKKLNRVVISNPGENTNPVSIETYLFDYPKYCDITKVDNSTNGLNGIKLTANSKTLKFVYAVIWFNDKYFVSQIELAKKKSKFTAELAQIKINQKLKNSDLIFNMEKGVKIVDLR